MSDQKYPWFDCRVAFKYEGKDEDFVWDKLENATFPEGWSLIDTLDSGDGIVVVFIVEGDLRVEDGDTIVKLLKVVAALESELTTDGNDDD